MAVIPEDEHFDEAFGALGGQALGRRATATLDSGFNTNGGRAQTMVAPSTMDAPKAPEKQKTAKEEKIKPQKEEKDHPNKVQKKDW